MATCIGVIKKTEELEEDTLGRIVVKSATEVQWTVPVLCSVVEEKPIKSSSFLFMDGKWRLIYFINRVDGDELPCLGLERVQSPSSYIIKFRVGIVGGDGSEVLPCNQDHEFKYDGDRAKTSFPALSNIDFQKRKSLRRNISFFCSFLSCSGKSETPQKRPSKGADKRNENFEKLFLSGDHHDIIIKVQDQEFRVHKFILVAQSPVFDSMFRHDTIEKNTGVITIEECDPEAFREFLFFLYSGKLKNLSAENVIEIYVIADKYQVDEVKTECVEFMMRNMSDETFCDYISLALKHNERDLLNFATDYFNKHVKTIIVTVKWLSFLKEFPVECNELYIKAINRPIPD